MIVGMNRLALGITQDRGRPCRDHLVRVHVGGGAASGLEDVDDELGIVAALHHLLRGCFDGAGDRRWEGPDLLVGPRRGELHQLEGI